VGDRHAERRHERLRRHSRTHALDEVVHGASLSPAACLEAA
jgi:hypothetical protein